MIILILFNALCVWRFPDRDLKEIFDADAYETMLVAMSEAQQDTIEARLGTELDPDETEFKFYSITRKGEPVGVVSTHLSKGQYGAIEVVVGFIPDSEKKMVVVKAVRIQRDREKARQALRSRKFLDQFIGKTAEDRLVVGDDIESAGPAAGKSSAAIALAVRKMLVVYETLMLKSASDRE